MARERQEVIPGFSRSELDEWKREARAVSDQFREGYEAGLEEAGDFFSSDSDSSSGNGEGGKPGSGGSAPAGPRFSFQSDAQKIIIVSLSITVIVALIENAHNDPKTASPVNPPRIIVGGFVSGAILLGMSYFVPEFASGLAIVAMLTTILEKGKPFWDIIGSLTGHPLPDTGPKTPSGGSTPSVPAGQSKLIGTATPNPSILV